MQHRITGLLWRLIGWLDNQRYQPPASAHAESIDWWRVLPFVGLHLALIALYWVGWSPFAVAFAIGLYLIRMFAITGFYHRYFAHKTFQTSRAGQFLFALIGATAVQRGPLWWAAHHRSHHVHADQPQDIHSPHQHGLLWSHLGWFLSHANFKTQLERVRELTRFRELCWLDRFDSLVPLALALGIFLLGTALAHYAPQLQTNGWQLLVWGFVVSTVALYHATFCVNSLAHVWGSRRYATRDHSRNNWLIALLTLGEGWHNNHHHFPGSVKQGFYWWEIDLTYYGLRVLAALGLIWNLKQVPVEVRDQHHQERPL
ncbi:acyl-CoA desaturase [Methylophilus sp. VKM B-3414]|uniref:acyl-CoA desaturase n=1 Tax=Methylophilus sp. VKM B-3414 TaxID=3076121 RepID=UPI0028C61D21|nr:acyl-CoA desaturase [Methylophilus sp. VKM B-3414]MDT7850723.1 acyl-CoA desaturase [Methylophilus sp. VKM B-3414]